jgi:hypothetical protein
MEGWPGDMSDPMTFMESLDAAVLTALQNNVDRARSINIDSSAGVLRDVVDVLYSTTTLPWLTSLRLACDNVNVIAWRTSTWDSIEAISVERMPALKNLTVHNVLCDNYFSHSPTQLASLDLLDIPVPIADFRRLCDTCASLQELRLHYLSKDQGATEANREQLLRRDLFKLPYLMHLKLHGDDAELLFFTLSLLRVPRTCTFDIKLLGLHYDDVSDFSNIIPNGSAVWNRLSDADRIVIKVGDSDDRPWIELGALQDSKLPSLPDAVLARLVMWRQRGETPHNMALLLDQIANVFPFVRITSVHVILWDGRFNEPLPGTAETDDWRRLFERFSSLANLTLALDIADPDKYFVLDALDPEADEHEYSPENGLLPHLQQITLLAPYISLKGSAVWPLETFMQLKSAASQPLKLLGIISDEPEDVPEEWYKIVDKVVISPRTGSTGRTLRQ